MRYLFLLMFALIAFSLAACAPTAEQKSYRQVKCPACGYSFDIPAADR